ncbi:BTB/POZ domain [Rhizoctonia solani]|uniref:BTB/POZ domain n=1 Tax=Rhizoctonia solani TaxID=456999 RepID=A0A8H7HCY8_9AGAM|nr:BTB/POZ domain [Rhizoctonia solani]
MPLPSLNASIEIDRAELPFVPPSGGDIILRSRDGTNFLVHSTILKFTSPVFEDMISSRTTTNTIELPETANEISYLLRFIYPNKLPLTIGPGMIPSCLAAVQKYRVGGAVEIIDELISLDINTPAHELLSSDPTRAYQLALRFNLAKTKAAAAPLLIAEEVDFCDLDNIAELTQKYSSLGLACLMNIQAMRTKLLSEVLLRFDRAPVKPTGSNFNMYYDLSCGPCRADRDESEWFKSTPPSWALAWLRLVYETLSTSSKPLEKSDYLFQSTILKKFQGKGDVCQGCLGDFERINHQKSTFDAWAQGVKRVLEIQLARLKLVYAL